MDRTERFYRIDSLLQGGKVIPIERMLEELEVSLATFKRDLEYMRSRLNAPIEWDRMEGGYRYAGGASHQQQLPGLWFNASEAYALLMMQTLLKEMQPGLLASHIEPFQARLRALIETGEYPIEDVESRVKVLHVGTRSVPEKYFELVAGALLRKQRLQITYFSRGTGETTQREVSPQQLIHHRGNWYLAAWCHRQDAMRSFALDAIVEAGESGKAAKNLSRSALQEFVGQGYGIFSGDKVQWATLRFSPERARWVSREIWHIRQKARQEPDGHLILEVPFTDPRELVMDILRHGSQAEVLGPKALREAVRRELRETADMYN